MKQASGSGDPPPERKGGEPPTPSAGEANGSTGEADSEEAGSPDPSAATSPVDLEKLITMWPAVVDQVRQSGAEVLSRALEAARPIALDADGLLEVGFPPSAAFNKRKAEAQDARDCFADALKTIVGKRLRPVYVLLDSEPEAAGALSEDELIARLKDEFDATELGLDAGLDADVGATGEGTG